jgi:CRISPR-associated protein Csm4
MSVWKLVRLQFLGTAHFGELGIGIEETSERVRSDTLFSALIAVYARMFGSQAVSELLQQFCDRENQPPFCISSTFIYQQIGDNITYYLPKPLRFPCNYPDDDLNFFKTYKKKLNYLPLEIWQRWYQGEGFADSDELITYTNDGKSQGNLNQARAFAYGTCYKKRPLPKVAIDRVTRATNFYHTGIVQFQQGSQTHSGLYFLIHFPSVNKTLEHQLQAVLKWLGDEGLGGERSSGSGQFKAKWDSLSPTWQQVVDFKDNSYYTLLSLFWTNDEQKLNEAIADEKASYEIIERGGWVSSSPSGYQLRRKSIRMFAEGSVFSSEPIGKLADVTPLGFTNHQIYRSGISLSLPIKVKSE